MCKGASIATSTRVSRQRLSPSGGADDEEGVASVGDVASPSDGELEHDRHLSSSAANVAPSNDATPLGPDDASIYTGFDPEDTEYLHQLAYVFPLIQSTTAL